MAAAFVAKRVLSTLRCSSFVTSQTIVSMPTRCISFSRCLLDRKYTDKHEWVLADGKMGTIGISNHAQEQLGEIVYVELPEIGTELQREDVAGCLESVKAASDVYCPVDGIVTEVNETLKANPGLVNKHPLDEGWLYKIEMSDGCDLSSLMGEDAYNKFVESEDH